MYRDKSREPYCLENSWKAWARDVVVSSTKLLVNLSRQTRREHVVDELLVHLTAEGVADIAIVFCRVHSRLIQASYSTSSIKCNMIPSSSSPARSGHERYVRVTRELSYLMGITFKK